MGQISKQFVINCDILKTCRKQIGLSLEQVAERVPFLIESIEKGKKRPTYKQLDTLAELYQVPRWVFVSNELPKQYQYAQKPSFRAFKEYPMFKKDSRFQKMLIKVENYRDLFIELQKDLGESITKFNSPSIDNKDISTTANCVRSWLAIAENQYLDFSELKKKLETKGIFIFLTSKYKGWSYIERDNAFRGLAIIDKVMPIIIINSSDSKKAQSFTLIHELGHILRGNTGIDSEDEQVDSDIERWCNQFAGEFLMPKKAQLWDYYPDYRLSEIKALAKQFKVSPYACLVRLQQLDKINDNLYDENEKLLKSEYEQQKKKLKESTGGPARDRVKEVYQQFGDSFVSTVLTTWHSQKITLHKVAKLLDLKQPKQVLELDNFI